MKIKLITLLLVLCHSFTQAQINHDFKIDLPHYLNKHILPHYELILSKHIGVEVAIGYDYNEIGISEPDSVFIFTTTPDFTFKNRELNPSLGINYYIGKGEKYGYGFFLGPYIRLNYLLHREEGYIEKVEEIFDIEVNEWRRREGVKELKYGINLGYKWLIKSHFIIEIVSSMTYDKRIGSGSSEYKGALDNFVFFKLGYRI